MVLKRGDNNDAVKALQRNLNKLGSMLLVDGDFGQGTEKAIINAREVLNQPGPAEADDTLLQAVANVPDPCPPLTAAGMTFIAQKEVTSAPTYDRNFRKPCFPGGESGVTIGIGYDLRFVERATLVADWGSVLPAEMIDSLAGVLKKQGTKQLATDLASVEVPLSAAMQVFARRSLPEFLRLTRSIYPQVDGLTSAQRTALVSLVYNRGTKLEGDGRVEMKAIRDLLAAGNLADVPAQILNMRRLVDPAKSAGLITRREAEAALWRDGFVSAGLE
jgi:GH24 family phage-related lysozyme (muramidase)